jgi:hypothetical protein
MTMPTPDHMDVGAYVLGILDPPEQAAFQKHFANCARCRAEYRELADLPRLLEQIKPEIEPAPSMQALDGALAEIAASRRGRRRNMWLAAAAAGVLLVGLPFAVLQQAEDGSDTSTEAGGQPTTTRTHQEPSTGELTAVAGARTLTGTDRDTGATAILTVDGDSEATTVDLQLFAVSGPASGKLVAIDHRGNRTEVTPWKMGIDQPSAKERGTVDVPLLDIAAFELVQSNGPVKIRIVA